MADYSVTFARSACNSKGSIMSKASDRYVKVVAWSEEDQCYVGRCPGLMLGGVHGSDERAVYAELCDVVDEWIRLHEAEGWPRPEPTSLQEIEPHVGRSGAIDGFTGKGID